MADNPSVRAGTVGGTIVVAADEVTVYGGAAMIQGVKIHDGTESGTVGAKVSAGGEMYVWQGLPGTVAGTVNIAGAVLTGNSGTVTLVGSTSVVHVNNSATATLTGTNPVFVTNNGTVAVSGAVLTGNTGTVTLTGTNPVFQTNDGTVSVKGN